MKSSSGDKTKEETKASNDLHAPHGDAGRSDADTKRVAAANASAGSSASSTDAKPPEKQADALHEDATAQQSHADPLQQFLRAEDAAAILGLIEKRAVVESHHLCTPNVTPYAPAPPSQKMWIGFYNPKGNLFLRAERFWSSRGSTANSNVVYVVCFTPGTQATRPWVWYVPNAHQNVEQWAGLEHKQLQTFQGHFEQTARTVLPEHRQRGHVLAKTAVDNAAHQPHQPHAPFGPHSGHVDEQPSQNELETAMLQQKVEDLEQQLQLERQEKHNLQATIRKQTQELLSLNKLQSKQFAKAAAHQTQQEEPKQHQKHHRHQKHHKHEHDDNASNESDDGSSSSRDSSASSSSSGHPSPATHSKHHVSSASRHHKHKRHKGHHQHRR